MYQVLPGRRLTLIDLLQSPPSEVDAQDRASDEYGSNPGKAVRQRNPTDEKQLRNPGKWLRRGGDGGVGPCGGQPSFG